jgi:hypothetical protein
MFPEEIDEIET